MLKRHAAFLVGILIAVSGRAEPVDKIFLKDGQVLSGRLVNPSFRFSTIYGEIDIPNAACLELARLDDRLERLKTVNDEVITGFAVDNPRIAIANGPTFEVRRELVAKVVFGARQRIDATNSDYFMMKNGDSFKGRALDRTFLFTTSYGTVDTAFSSILKLEDVNGQTRVHLADGNELLGYIGSDFINVRTAYGFALKVPKSSVKLIQMR